MFMNIYGQTFAKLEEYLLQIGEKPSKAGFIYQGLYRQQVSSLMDLPIIKCSLRQRLATDFNLPLPRLVQQTEGDDTAKFLFALADGNVIEAVLMRQKYGNSLCISTQVGCNMGCAFCQSGRLKKVRNLKAGEMVAQLLSIEQALGLAISNVVLMGIGEPFDNYDAVIDFIDIINHQKGLNIGMRHITLSTCGIVPRIYDYMHRPTPGPLAISLHAPNDALRNQLMPVNRRYPLAQLMAAVKAYTTATNKKVMLEYVMLAGINDQTEHAQQLAQLIDGSDCHVNLIPYNDTQNLGFTASPFVQIKAFYDILRAQHIFVNLRREFGASVQAACGQLRAEYTQQTKQAQRL